MTPGPSAVDTNTTGQFASKRRLIAFALLLLACMGGIWLWSSVAPVKPVEKPEMVILPSGYLIPPQRSPVPDRWIPAKWGWLWRIRYALLGKPTIVQLRGEVAGFPSATVPQLTSLLKAHLPVVETNGVRAWILTERQMESIRLGMAALPGYEAAASPRITTAHNVHSQLANTYTTITAGMSNTVGLLADFLTTDQRNGMELTAVLNHTDKVKAPPTRASTGTTDVSTFAIRTNLSLAARFRLPPGYGVLVVQSNPASSNQRMGTILLFASQRKAK